MSKVDLKVVLLGKEYGGKTSLVERYVHQRFSERAGNKPYQATIGAAYASKKLEINGKQITLGIWDTAGSERYESMSRMYYRNARAAVVCMDLTDEHSFDRAKFWISELTKNEETCKIYLCGTKCDLTDANSNSRRINKQTATNYGNAIGSKYYETSSKLGTAVDTLFTEIAKDYVNFQMSEASGKFDSSSDHRFTIDDGRKKSLCCFR